MHTVYPSDRMFGGEPIPLGDARWRMLAEGDSWFSLGTTKLSRGSNLLIELGLTQWTAIVTCAYPGDTLQRMVDWKDDPHFKKLLGGPAKWTTTWDAILLSAGGNDLIAAAQTPLVDDAGRPTPLDRRLLRTLQEATSAHNPPSAADFVSPAGWDLLTTHLYDNMSRLVRRRDQGPSRDRPLFLHTYAVPTVRPSGVPGAKDGWLYPAFKKYGIPTAMTQEVAKYIFGLLRAFLLSLDAASGSQRALAHVRVFDGTSVNLDPASPTDRGKSGDWINEIHLTTTGYRAYAKALGAFIESVLLPAAAPTAAPSTQPSPPPAPAFPAPVV